MSVLYKSDDWTVPGKKRNYVAALARGIGKWVSVMGGCQSNMEHDCVIGSISDIDLDESDNDKEETQCVENEDMKKRMKENLFKAIELSECGRLSQLLREAFDLGIDIINCQNTDRPSCDYARGNTLLHDASSKGHYELCEILLKSGASVNLKNTDGFTALHKAKSLKVCKLLSKYGAEFEATTKRRETVLHYAADAQIANYYISRGLKVTQKQAFNQSCLETILTRPDLEPETKLGICKVMLESGADVNNFEEIEIDQDIEIRKIIDLAQLEIQADKARTMKIYICGSKDSGKTTLYKTLLRSKLRSRITVERTFSNYWPYIYNFFQIKTIAIDIVEKDYIPGVKGFFSFREFSSKAPYFLINATFTQGNCPVIFVVYDLSEDEKECQNKLLHWLNQIKASRNRESTESELENILIIATRADSPAVNDVNLPSREAAQNKASRILDYCKDNFNDVLNIVGERPFLVDARFGRDEGFEEIKDTLKTLKSTLQCPITMDRNMFAAEDNSHQLLHRICDEIIRAKRTWIRPVPAIPRRDALFNPKFPVLKWDEYERKVLAAVKGVTREDVKTCLKSVTNILNDWDELIFVEREQCSDSIIVLKPEWLTSKLLVPLFFEEANSKYLIPVSDAYEKHKLKISICRKGWNDIQTDVIMELAEHFDLLFPCDGDDRVILPTRLPDEPLTTQTFVSGVSYELQNETDILLPTFFPKLQFKLKNKYKRITELFRTGVRINDTDVTGHVHFLENQKIFVLSSNDPERQNVEAQHLKLLNEISKCIEEAVGEGCRGRALRLTKKYFNRSKLLGKTIDTIASLEEIPSYTFQQLVEAELKTDGVVKCKCYAARVSKDVLMAGHDFTIMKELGLACNAIWLPDKIYDGADGLEVLFREDFKLRDGNPKLLLMERLGLNGMDSQRSVKSLVCKWAAEDYKENSIGKLCKLLVEMDRPDAVSEIKSVLTGNLDQDIFQRINPDKEDVDLH